MLVFKKNYVFDEWDVIYLLLMNEIIVFIWLVLFEDLGSVNLERERNMYMRNVIIDDVNVNDNIDMRWC